MLLQVMYCVSEINIRIRIENTHYIKYDKSDVWLRFVGYDFIQKCKMKHLTEEEKKNR